LVAVLVVLLCWINLLSRVRLRPALLRDCLRLVLLRVIGAHLVHLGLEDTHRAAKGTGGIRQARCAEHEEDNQQQDEDVATREHEGFCLSEPALKISALSLHWGNGPDKPLAPLPRVARRVRRGLGSRVPRPARHGRSGSAPTRRRCPASSPRCSEPRGWWTWRWIRLAGPRSHPRCRRRRPATVGSTPASTARSRIVESGPTRRPYRNRRGRWHRPRWTILPVRSIPPRA